MAAIAHSEEKATPEQYRIIYIVSNQPSLLEKLRDNNLVHLAARSNASPVEFTSSLTTEQLERLSPNHLLYFFTVISNHKNDEQDIRNLELHLGYFQVAQSKGARAITFLTCLKGKKELPEMVDDMTEFLIMDLKK